MTTLPYARIYRLINDDGLVYYGSTTQKYLSSRLTNHKADAKNRNFTSKLLFEGGKDVRIELVENCEVTDRYELHNRERYYIQNNECVNKCIPNRSKKEHYEDNKDKIAEQKKKYRAENKETKAAQDKEYQQKNKEAIAAQKKEYYEKNKEAIAAQRKESYAKKKLVTSQTD